MKSAVLIVLLLALSIALVETLRPLAPPPAIIRVLIVVAIVLVLVGIFWPGFSLP
jgi:heme/copper-type cytochrome/quinol oxidase subunit 2